ncbi:MAG TPA: L,D-transpeptidase family protein [Caulobacteraceae bacterium]|nr:L,D-transpeptidase family protein [Caulobacteraceae bacterium]
MLLAALLLGVPAYASPRLATATAVAVEAAPPSAPANPIAAGLQAALDDLHAGRVGPGAFAALKTTRAAYEQRLELNLRRAAELPSTFPRRYIIVDIPAQMLWLYEDGRLALSMPVVVGKPTEPTPTLITEVKSAVFNPYWNVPWDLARNTWAPRIVKQGVKYLKTVNMQVLAPDNSPEGRVVAPDSVNWNDVAAGRIWARLRQLPGPNNMMGAVKFEMPNEQGIYLHDTPLKQFFRASQRTLSAGCVRLSHAEELAKALLGAAAPAGDTPPETRVDLPEPVAVYITYLTATPVDGVLRFFPDVYRRDKSRN